MMKSNGYWFFALAITVIISIFICGCISQVPPPERGLLKQPAPPGDFPPALKTVAEPPAAGGQDRTLQLGNIEITSFDTITMPGNWEYSTDIYLTLKNKGSSSETIEFTKTRDMIDKFPQWAWHFFDFQKNIMTIMPKEEKNIHYFISNEGEGEFSFNIDFWRSANPSEKVTATIKIVSKRDLRLEPSSAVYGIVKDSKGNPVSGVEVEVFSYNGREQFIQTTGSDGKYVIYLPAVEDIRKILGNRKLPYKSLNYFLIVEDEKYSYFYKDGISPNRTEPYRVDITLNPAPSKLSLKLKWEKQVEDYFGFFWVYADSSWQRIAAQQAKHPPELNKPAHTYMFDSTGKQLWAFATGNECWGFDMLADGTLAMGCHDGKIYVVEKDGKLRWSHDSGSGAMVREVEFSHDGKYLIAGPPEPGFDAALFDAGSGTVLKKFGKDDLWLRNSKFYPDDKKFVIGKSSGYISAYDLSGNELWNAIIGEFPMFMAIGSNGVTYTSGKSRTLYAFDSSGNIKWEYRIPDHTGGAGAISDDGSRIAIGTVAGWVYLFDDSGNLLWRVRTDGESIGHNAIAITADGKYVVAGTAPQNTVFVYDENGNKVWSYSVKPSPNSILDEKYSTIGYKASRGSQEGVMHVKIAADASKIVAAYGDNFVRMFEK